MSVVAWAQESQEKIDQKGTQESFSSDGNILYFDGDGITQLHKSTKLEAVMILRTKNLISTHTYIQPSHNMRF